MNDFVDMRVCPESAIDLNVLGIAKNARTSQDHLPITKKTGGLIDVDDADCTVVIICYGCRCN